MTYSYVHQTERVGDLIVQVVNDDHYINPYKDFDQTSEVFGQYRHLDLDEPPREHMRILERGGLPLLVRYMKRFGDPRDGSPVLAIKQLGLLDHSGITIWTEDIGSRAAHFVDPGGWDTSHVGYVLITKSRWDLVNGGDPEEMVDGEVRIGFGHIPVKQRRADHVLEAEVKEWDSCLTGDVWGFVVTKPCDHADEHSSDEAIAECPHSETIESCWGFIGEPEYAFSEGKAVAEASA